MNEINVGEKVRVVKDYNFYVTSGMIGTVIVCSCSGKSLGIKFPHYIMGGNDLNGKCEYGYGYYVCSEFLERVDDKNINKASDKKNDFLPSDVQDVIINDNTVVVNLKDGRKGVSKCSNEDTFDTYSGFVNAYYRAKNDHIFDLKKVLNNCVKSANKKGYKQAILKNYD